MSSNLLDFCQINMQGLALEKAGRIDEAIALYEYGVANGTDTPGTYDRLLVLYRKAKRLEDERRLCELAANRWPVARDGHGNVFQSSFSSRLARIDALIERRKKRQAMSPQTRLMRHKPTTEG